MSRWVTNGLVGLIFIGLCLIAQGLRFEPLDRTGFDNTSHWVFDRLTGRLCIVRGVGGKPVCASDQFINSFK